MLDEVALNPLIVATFPTILTILMALGLVVIMPPELVTSLVTIVSASKQPLTGV